VASTDIPHHAREASVPLHAEEVSVTRREVAGDTLRIRTVTREQDHHIDESLTHTRVEIERVPVGRPIERVPAIREEGDTTVLAVVEEIIVVERRLFLKEEVRIKRVEVADRHQETVTARQQDVVISRIEAPSTADGDDRLPTPPNTQPQQDTK
jgi:stress response protein YsnF